MQSQLNPRQFRAIITVGAVLFGLLISWSSITFTIPSGYAGLMFRTFNDGISTEEAPFGQGFHFKAPWNRVLEYEVRQQESLEHLNVLSANLLKIELDVTVFHQPVLSNLGRLEIERGRNYEKDVIVPSMRAVAREVFAKYLPEEINTSKRSEIQAEINNLLEQKLAENYIQLNDVLIRNIKLPKTLEDAIERKLQQEQQSLEYEFRLEKEAKEADRKRIEAQGIQDFQDIVSEGISEELLRWKGIEATAELAKSVNSKVVVIGGGDDGLPIILGGND
ncbi:MAG: prohibitin family protein [Flavobacteriales bacterium]|nr:prohibitin family protein [Flavobacteriales bacterium]